MRFIYRTVLKQSQYIHCQRSHVTSALSEVNDSNVRPFEEIPGPRGLCSMPIIGPAFLFKPFTKHTLEKVHKMFTELIDTYGSIVRVNLGQWTLLVEDARDIQVVIKNEGRYPNRSVHAVHQIYCQENGVREGLSLLQGKEWYSFRSPLNSRMGRVSCAHHYLHAQSEVADDLVKRLKKDVLTAEELFKMIFKYTCESLGVVAFNTRLGYLSPDVDTDPDKLQSLQDIRDMFRLQNECLYIPPFLLKHFPLKVKREYNTVLDRIARHSQSYYRSSLDEIEKGLKDGTIDLDGNNLLLSLMMSDRLSVEDMGALALDFLSGGADSTARAIQMLLYVLARNPEKQQKLYKEIIGTLGPGEPITVKVIKGMTYLPACVRESFRLFHPVLCGTQRYLPTDITLQGYRIPAGTSIVLMSQQAAKNEKYFPDPESYVPERWLRDEAGNRPTAIPATALTPFGVGSRQCVGKRFAEQEIFLAAIKILQNFKVSLEPGFEDIDVIYQIFVATKEPIRFVLKDRK